MPKQEKNTKNCNTHLMILLPVAGSFFVKKTPPEMPTHTTLDFHLEMIKKIDKMLVEHDEETISAPILHTPPLIPPQPPTPIEPRPPLNKTFSHEEIHWEPATVPPRPHLQTIPEEFKTELTIIPEFRFITSQEFTETIQQKQPSSPSEDRVEIIDISTLTGDRTPIHRTMHLMNTKNKDEETPVSTLKSEKLEKDEYHGKKVEVIDAHMIKSNVDDKTYTTASDQTDQIEKKAKVYFLNKKEKEAEDTTQKKEAQEQSYLPDDIEERFKVLREKKKKEEEAQKRLQEHQRLRELQAEQENKKKEEGQRRILEEKRLRELEIEQEKQKKEDEKRQVQEEKQLRKLQAEQEKQKKEDEKRRAYEEKKHRKLQGEHEKLTKQEPEKNDPDEQPLSLETISVSKTASELKKELKEQKRHHQLAIRKARIEERQRKKEEKEALKAQRQQGTPKQGLRGKFEKKPPQPPQIEKQDSSEEILDEDIRKVLLITDYLLGELPEEVLNIFLESEEFALYEKVLNKYKIK